MRDYADAISFYFRNPARIFRQIHVSCRNGLVDEPFIFVLGPPRSGTTMIQRLMLNHSSIIGFEEETAIFSIRSVEDYRRFAHFVSRDVHRNALKQSTSLAGFCVALHREGLPRANGEIFLEKTPQHSRWLRYIATRFPNAKFIFCVRDPRDTFCSARASSVIPQSSNLHRHARYFKSCVTDIIKADRTIRDRTFIIRYENFVEAPWETLDRMSCFFGLSLETQQQLQKSRQTRDARASRSEFARLSEEISSKTVARWKKELSTAEARTYASITGPEMHFFGYETG